MNVQLLAATIAPSTMDSLKAEPFGLHCHPHGVAALVFGWPVRVSCPMAKAWDSNLNAGQASTHYDFPSRALMEFAIMDRRRRIDGMAAQQKAN